MPFPPVTMMFRSPTVGPPIRAFVVPSRAMWSVLFCGNRLPAMTRPVPPAVMP
jgi:hypothetical protein